MKEKSFEDFKANNLNPGLHLFGEKPHFTGVCPGKYPACDPEQSAALESKDPFPMTHFNIK